MKLACDLHIHSCLSPCGDALMTPNTIVGMAFIMFLAILFTTLLAKVVSFFTNIVDEIMFRI